MLLDHAKLTSTLPASPSRLAKCNVVCIPNNKKKSERFVSMIFMEIKIFAKYSGLKYCFLHFGCTKTHREMAEVVVQTCTKCQEKIVKGSFALQTNHGIHCRKCLDIDNCLRCQAPPSETNGEVKTCGALIAPCEANTLVIPIRCAECKIKCCHPLNVVRRDQAAAFGENIHDKFLPEFHSRLCKNCRQIVCRKCNEHHMKVCTIELTIVQLTTCCFCPSTENTRYIGCSYTQPGTASPFVICQVCNELKHLINFK